MKIGYAQIIITPSLDRPVYLAGFGQNRRAQSVHDDLFARALALSAGNITLVVLITIFNFPCHPEVLWEYNSHMTSDYPASLRQTVEMETGVPCIFFSGALGGMMTPDVLDHSFAEASAIGKKLAQAGSLSLSAQSA